MPETSIQPLSQEDPLEKEMATHSVFLPGKSHGQRSLAGYSLQDCKELDTTEATQQQQLCGLKTFFCLLTKCNVEMVSFY